MATIAQNITAIATAKTNLAANLTTKGVTSTDTEPLATLVGKILDIPSGEYSPPADWIDISTITNGNINLLVSDSSMATYALLCTTSTGTYHVDWGDGTSNDYASASTAQHTYTAGTGQVCSRGYTTFKIVISPNTGNLIAFKVTSHSLSAQDQYHDILACVIAATLLQNISNAFYKSTAPKVICPGLEYCKIVGTLNVCTGTPYMFAYCSSLCYVDISGLIAVTNASYMFTYCSAISHVDVSGMVAVTNASYMFSYCYALSQVDVSGFTAVTSANYMFYSCYALQYIDVSSMDAVTGVNFMFASCYSLRSIDVSNMVNVSSAEGIFYYCYSLKTVIATNFSTNKSAVSFYNAFTNCEQLVEINFPAAKMTALTAKGISGKLNKLATITMNPGSVLNAYTTSMDLQYNTLTANQLDAIFTNLPAVSGRTINITGCTGAATCTRSIATAKGWTVTG